MVASLYRPGYADSTFMQQKIKNQIIGLTLTVLTCLGLIAALWLEIHLLNRFGDAGISLIVHPADVLVGMTIYLKTSIDFAIFIGRLMDKNQGLKGRIGIEIGTSLGNAAGTMAILLLWVFFRRIDWLLAIMIVLAALVLLRLAQDGLEHADTKNKSLKKFITAFDTVLSKVNNVIDPFLSKIVPSNRLAIKTKRTLLGLLTMSFTIPFILGLDDFAGYVPLFKVVNIFGFSIGVFVGHMLLVMFLFLSPEKTTKLVKNAVISVIGSIAFVILSGWGLYEAFKLLFLHH